MTLTELAGAALLNGLAQLIDHGGYATLTVYTGPMPQDGGDIESQTALATLTCASPATVVENSTLTFNPITPAMVLETGEAAWVRLKNGAEETVADLAVGDDIQLSATMLYPGVNLSVSSLTISG